LARIDGSEFLLLLSNIREEKTVIHLSEKLRIGMSAPVVVDGNSITLQISIGAALFPRDGESMEELLAHARAEFGLFGQGRKRIQTTSSNWIKLIKTSS